MATPDLEEFKKRKEEWRPGHQPLGAEGEWLLEPLAATTLRMDRCREQESAIRHDQKMRANLCRDDERQTEAIEVAARLAKEQFSNNFPDFRLVKCRCSYPTSAFCVAEEHWSVRPVAPRASPSISH